MPATKIIENGSISCTLVLYIAPFWKVESGKEGSRSIHLDFWSAFLLTWIILLSWKYGIIAKTFVQNKISVVFKDITCQISEIYVKFKMADWWHFFVNFAHASETLYGVPVSVLNERFCDIYIKCVHTQHFLHVVTHDKMWKYYIKNCQLVARDGCFSICFLVFT